MEKYPAQQIESKWQAYWEKQGIFKARDDSSKPEFYMLEMYPYPSGDLHVGHMSNYILGDVVAHYKRMCGFEVLHPFGWDAFGLPAENAAIQRGVPPKEWTLANIAQSKASIKMMGLSYDWDREVTTCLPDYYKWTQWFFVQLFKNNLAYRADAAVNWCTGCLTVLANEQVLSDGTCYRCGSAVHKKMLTQWFFRITAYAQRLLADIDKMDGWMPEVLTMQRNWIGRSEGNTIVFEVKGFSITLPVFTTRADTLFGVTFMTIAPEHPLVKELIANSPQHSQVEAYIAQAMDKSEIERTSTIREKDGVFSGCYAVNPLSGDKVPIWVGDYVLVHYGTGIVMGVPAHDQRDFQFAKRYGLPIKVVIQPADSSLQAEKMSCAYEEYGVMVNSLGFDGLPSMEGIKKVTDELIRQNRGDATVTYKLRDWLISRQRYWGCPIPIIHCPQCGLVPIPEEQLPLLLPPENTVDFTPQGGSVLASNTEWMKATCPQCGGPARHDPDTMDTYICSSWYFFRYCDPKNDRAVFDPAKVRHWMPIDQYIGGKEHATSHLLYSRFFVKFLKDLGYFDFNEPFINYFSQGMIHRLVKKADGQEGMEIMSKSKGNAVPVGPFVQEWGSDTARILCLFAGPPEMDKIWSDQGVVGANRFLNRVWRIVTENIKADGYKAPHLLDMSKVKKEELTLYRKLHRTIKKVTEDLESIHFNTAISAIMELVNDMYLTKDRTCQSFSACLGMLPILLAPFAPHISDELWHRIGGEESILVTPWRKYDRQAISEETCLLVVQIDGKVRDRVEITRGLGKKEVEKIVLALPKLQSFLSGKKVAKFVLVPDKLANIVLKK